MLCIAGLIPKSEVTSVPKANEDNTPTETVVEPLANATPSPENECNTQNHILMI
jgi:hypothetical protein